MQRDPEILVKLSNELFDRRRADAQALHAEVALSLEQKVGLRPNRLPSRNLQR
jgi:hypothetical protein